MKKPPFTQTLWWTTPSQPFNPDGEYFAHQRDDVDMEPHGWVKVGTAEVTYTIFDNANPLQKQIKALDKEIERIQEEAAKKINQFRQMKANLLALPGPGGDN